MDGLTKTTVLVALAMLATVWTGIVQGADGTEADWQGVGVAALGLLVAGGVLAAAALLRKQR